MALSQQTLQDWSYTLDLKWGRRLSSQTGGNPHQIVAHQKKTLKTSKRRRCLVHRARRVQQGKRSVGNGHSNRRIGANRGVDKRTIGRDLGGANAPPVQPDPTGNGSDDGGGANAPLHEDELARVA